jgi:hypothetical protein
MREEYISIGVVDFVAKLSLMTPEERERMNWLVLRIQQEKDRDVFSKLVDELNKLIEQKERRFPAKRTT